MVPPTSHKVSRVSWYSGSCHAAFPFTYGAFTLFGRLSQNRSVRIGRSFMQSLTPECTHSGLGSSAFARRYLRNRVFFLFLRLLRCFSSPGSLPEAMDLLQDDRSFSGRVSPFRNLRIIAHLRLPAAYRSLSRLSSALSAKASALCSCRLTFPCLGRTGVRLGFASSVTRVRSLLGSWFSFLMSLSLFRKH